MTDFRLFDKKGLKTFRSGRAAVPERDGPHFARRD
jgi:hypothetical protein